MLTPRRWRWPRAGASIVRERRRRDDAGRGQGGPARAAPAGGAGGGLPVVPVPAPPPAARDKRSPRPAPVRQPLRHGHEWRIRCLGRPAAPRSRAPRSTCTAPAYRPRARPTRTAWSAQPAERDRRDAPGHLRQPAGHLLVAVGGRAPADQRQREHGDADPLSETFPGFPDTQLAGWGQRTMRVDRLDAGVHRGRVKVAVIDSGAASLTRNSTASTTARTSPSRRRTTCTWSNDVIAHGSHCTGVIAGAERPGHPRIRARRRRSTSYGSFRAGASAACSTPSTTASTGRSTS